MNEYQNYYFSAVSSQSSNLVLLKYSMKPKYDEDEVDISAQWLIDNLYSLDETLSDIEILTEEEYTAQIEVKKNVLSFGIVGSDKYKTQQMNLKFGLLLSDPETTLEVKNQIRDILDFERTNMLDYYQDFSPYENLY